MKKLSISILAILFCIAAIGQPATTRNQLSKYDYQNKSIKQKKTAWLFLSCGGAIAIGGASYLIYLGTVDDPAPELKNFAIGMCVFGAGGMAASIPFFNASARNKRKANEVTLNLGFEKLFAIQQIKKGSSFYPALSFKIRIQ